jgi:LuxR family quorum-sensing system transcriptional regulator SolR
VPRHRTAAEDDKNTSFESLCSQVAGMNTSVLSAASADAVDSLHSIGSVGVGELEILSRLTNDIRSHSDLEDQVRELMSKVAGVIPFRRCVVVHARDGRTLSRGFVYRGTRGDELEDEIDDTSSCGPALDVPEYLRCFGIHARHDHGFRWYHAGRFSDGLDATGMELADFMRGAEGLGAEVHSTTADHVMTLVQLECEPGTCTRHKTLLLGFIAFCLHSRFMVQAIHPEMQQHLLGINLTAKERDVLKWVIEGKTSWEIGRILATSERTVKFHLKNVYAKLNVSNRAQAVAVVNRLNLL